MNHIIEALIENEMAENHADAISIINSMKEDIDNGEDIEDVLYQYDLELDYAIDLLE